MESSQLQCRLGCFVPRQSATVGFAHVQTPPYFGTTSPIGPGVKSPAKTVQQCRKQLSTVQSVPLHYSWLIVLCCVQGDKDFTPAAAQVAHQKPQPGVPKLAPVQHIKQQIHQPRKWARRHAAASYLLHQPAFPNGTHRIKMFPHQTQISIIIRRLLLSFFLFFFFSWQIHLSLTVTQKPDTDIAEIPLPTPTAFAKRNSIEASSLKVVRVGVGSSVTFRI